MSSENPSDKRPARPLQKLPLRHDPALPFVFLAAGLTLVAVMSRFDERAGARQAWGDSVIVRGDAAAEPAAAGQGYPVRVRTLSEENYPQFAAFMREVEKTPQGTELAVRLRDSWCERAAYLSVPREMLGALLAEGRLPESGEAEALAGDLARLDSFELDGVTFRVVGRLQRGIAALSSCYVVREDDGLFSYFTEQTGAVTGLLFPKYDPEPAPFAEPAGVRDQEPPRYVAGMARTPPAVSWGTVLGLLLAVVGGSTAQTRFLLWLRGRPSGVLGPALDEMALRPKLIAGIHGVLFGLFFAFMALAVAFPAYHACVVQLVAGEFTEGRLGYIGEAYASKNIVRAACATFFHNFAIATVSFSVLPSLIIPFAGLLKNALSFALVGFAMAPNWAGSISHLVYHSITLIVELEAYVLAAFVISALPVRIYEGLVLDRFAREWYKGLIVVGSGTLLAGLILAAAASYEAITIILLR